MFSLVLLYLALSTIIPFLVLAYVSFLPYLQVPSARAFGAKVTPHFFVLDKDRTVQYMGALDNSTDAPSTPYLANAVDALLGVRLAHR